MSEKKIGLELMREPFPAHQISKLPKPTAGKEVMEKIQKGKCHICGGWHQVDKIIHLDYVGHAALTDRLLDCDKNWSWEPLALRDGLPAFDATGGLWIRLTVCGVSRLGYGNAAPSQYKEVGSREKEVIGDALRNAAMRFGAALDLWHKGELHIDGDYNCPPGGRPAPAPEPTIASLPPLAHPPAVEQPSGEISGTIISVEKREGKAPARKPYWAINIKPDNGEAFFANTPIETDACEARDMIGRPAVAIHVERNGKFLNFISVAPF